MKEPTLRSATARTVIISAQRGGKTRDGFWELVRSGAVFDWDALPDWVYRMKLSGALKRSVSQEKRSK